MKKAILFLFNLLLILHLPAQEIKWQSIILDEVLTISLPVGFSKIDTSYTQNKISVHSKVFQSNTETCTLYISVDSTNLELKIDDKSSVYIVLEGVAEGVCTQYSQAGFRCERSDTLIDNIPSKKFLFYENQTNLALFGYGFVANNKAYKIFSTLSNHPKNGLRPNDLNKLLACIKFNTSNIRGYEFYSKSETQNSNPNYSVSKILIPGMIAIALIAFFIKKIN